MNIINEKDGYKEVIDFAFDYLERGKVIAYPTETVYGLGCDATNLRAVKRINKLKGSNDAKSLLVLVDSLKMAKEYAVFNKTALKLAKEFWPGALSLILPTTELGQKTFKSKTIGLRISSNEIATGLTKKLGKPLVSTSANITGQPAVQTGLEVAGQFIGAADEPDLILDAGKLKKSKGSTIVDCVSEEMVVIRKGDLKL